MRFRRGGAVGIVTAARGGKAVCESECIIFRCLYTFGSRVNVDSLHPVDTLDVQKKQELPFLKSMQPCEHVLSTLRAACREIRRVRSPMQHSAGRIFLRLRVFCGHVCAWALIFLDSHVLGGVGSGEQAYIHICSEKNRWNNLYYLFFTNVSRNRGVNGTEDGNLITEVLTQRC
jgi:hypothetical protein